MEGRNQSSHPPPAPLEPPSRWRARLAVWWQRRIVSDVPAELQAWESCRDSVCSGDEWERCELRRLAARRETRRLRRVNGKRCSAGSSH